MQVAKASEQDIECADQLVQFTEALHSGWLPDCLVPNPDFPEIFDVEDAAQCQRVLRRMLDVTGPGSAGRAILGLKVLFHPETELLADSDVLELHPRFAQPGPIMLPMTPYSARGRS